MFKKLIEDRLGIIINILDDTEREEYLLKNDIIISMLPARLHMILANSCLKLKKI